MIQVLDKLDIAIFIVLLLSMPVLGLLAARAKQSDEQYFLAGRDLSWWKVAGSIFGTNVSASHMIGMLGIGYSLGFAQSHYEILAVAAILLLCYVFLPLYRKQEIFTLSEFLERRFSSSTRLLYSILMVLLILVQVVAAFYIGARTLMNLTAGTSWAIGYLPGIVMLALVSCSYTLYGGFNSVVVADIIQTVLIIAACLLVAWFTFAQPEIQGFSGLMALERAQPEALRKMSLYKPTNHPDLPWSGVFTGLIILHCFYWTTNQYLVQRTFAAKTMRDARIGVIGAGFLKLTIPFFSIATGVAAAYIFKSRLGEGHGIKPDDAFLRLIQIVVPLGYGLLGIIMAGIAAATFSSIDSMMNSVSTLITHDIYKKYAAPAADDRHLVRFGRIAVISFVVLCAILAQLTYDPQSAGNFFLKVSARGSYFTPGIVVVFLAGVLSRRITVNAAIITLVSAPLVAWFSEWAYSAWLVQRPQLHALLGDKLNFMHRVLITAIWSLTSVLIISRLSGPQAPAEDNDTHARVPVYGIASFLLVQLSFILLSQSGNAIDFAFPAALAAFGFFLAYIIRDLWHKGPFRVKGIVTDDRLYAGLLTAAAVFQLYYFA
ncbi:MAG: sodium/solute symporter [Chitinophagales bacterium]|nr:sodium/solute symporter [Chitinophagales bacterium]